jgi:hypothetical protein
MWTRFMGVKESKSERGFCVKIDRISVIKVTKIIQSFIPAVLYWEFTKAHEQFLQEVSAWPCSLFFFWIYSDVVLFLKYNFNETIASVLLKIEPIINIHKGELMKTRVFFRMGDCFPSARAIFTRYLEVLTDQVSCGIFSSR